MPGTITDPLGSVIQGMLTGHALATQIHRQKLEDEAFARKAAQDDQEASIKDIVNRMQLQNYTRPVNNGMVTLPGESAPDDMAGLGLPNPNVAPDYVRKADRSRTVKYKSPSGEVIEGELYTPQEQARRASDSSLEGEFQKQAGAESAQERVRRVFGQDPGDEINVANGFEPGTKHLMSELPALKKNAQAARKPEKVGPGESLVDTSGPTPKTVFTAPPKEEPLPAEVRAANKWYSTFSGKAEKDFDANDQAKAVRQWKELTEPADVTAARKSTLASQALERQVKKQELDLAGDDDVVKTAATKYLQTGQMPPLGMGSTLLRAKILGAATQIARDNGLAPEQIPALQDSYKALSTSLTDLQKRKGQVESFENGAAKNLDQFITLAQKQADTGSPLFNRAVRGGARTITGSPDQAAADAARITAFTEVSKVLSGSLGNGVLSDSARKEAEGLLSGNYTMKQLLKVSKVLRQDMKNRSGAIDEQISTTRKQMQGLTNPKAAAATGSQPASSGSALPQAGQVVVVNGKKVKITAIHPDGTFDADPVN